MSYSVNSDKTPFDRYYNSFLQNNMRGARYRIILQSGEVADGIPIAGSIIDPRNPNASFSFRRPSGDLLRIPFQAVLRAFPLNGKRMTIRTIAPNTLGGSDFEVSVSDSEYDLLFSSENTVEIEVAYLVGSGAPFIERAVKGTYKFATIDGETFNIESIESPYPGIIRTELNLVTR